MDSDDRKDGTQPLAPDPSSIPTGDAPPEAWEGNEMPEAYENWADADEAEPVAEPMVAEESGKIEVTEDAVMRLSEVLQGYDSYKGDEVPLSLALDALRNSGIPLSHPAGRRFAKMQAEGGPEHLSHREMCEVCVEEGLDVNVQVNLNDGTPGPTTYDGSDRRNFEVVRDSNGHVKARFPESENEVSSGAAESKPKARRKRTPAPAGTGAPAGQQPTGGAPGFRPEGGVPGFQPANDAREPTDADEKQRGGHRGKQPPMNLASGAVSSLIGAATGLVRGTFGSAKDSLRYIANLPDRSRAGKAAKIDRAMRQTQVGSGVLSGAGKDLFQVDGANNDLEDKLRQLTTAKTPQKRRALQSGIAKSAIAVDEAQRSFAEQMKYGGVSPKEERKGLKSFKRSNDLLEKARKYCADPESAKDDEDRKRLQKLGKMLADLVRRLMQMLLALFGMGKKGPGSEPGGPGGKKKGAEKGASGPSSEKGGEAAVPSDEPSGASSDKASPGPSGP